MKQNDIIGYEFLVLVKKGEACFIATAPGVGGVYEEGDTAAEAVKNAAEAACALFESRQKMGDLMTEDNQYLKVIRRPQRSARIVPELSQPNGYSRVCLLSA